MTAPNPNAAPLVTVEEMVRAIERLSARPPESNRIILLAARDYIREAAKVLGVRCPEPGCGHFTGTEHYAYSNSPQIIWCAHDGCACKTTDANFLANYPAVAREMGIE